MSNIASEEDAGVIRKLVARIDKLDRHLGILIDCIADEVSQCTGEEVEEHPILKQHNDAMRAAIKALGEKP